MSLQRILSILILFISVLSLNGLCEEQSTFSPSFQKIVVDGKAVYENGETSIPSIEIADPQNIQFDFTITNTSQKLPESDGKIFIHIVDTGSKKLVQGAGFKPQESMKSWTQDKVITAATKANFSKLKGKTCNRSRVAGVIHKSAL